MGLVKLVSDCIHNMALNRESRREILTAFKINGMKVNIPSFLKTFSNNYFLSDKSIRDNFIQAAEHISRLKRKGIEYKLQAFIQVEGIISTGLNILWDMERQENPRASFTHINGQKIIKRIPIYEKPNGFDISYNFDFGLCENPLIERNIKEIDEKAEEAIKIIKGLDVLWFVTYNPALFPNFLPKNQIEACSEYQRIKTIQSHPELIKSGYSADTKIRGPRKAEWFKEHPYVRILEDDFQDELSVFESIPDSFWQGLSENKFVCNVCRGMGEIGVHDDSYSIDTQEYISEACNHCDKGKVSYSPEQIKQLVSRPKKPKVDFTCLSDKELKEELERKGFNFNDIVILDKYRRARNYLSIFQNSRI